MSEHEREPERDPDDRFTCTLCGASFDPGDPVSPASLTAACRPWIILNRYAFGTGRSRVCVEGTSDDGAYLWELDPAPDGDDYVTGPLLCWPQCAVMWLEAKGVEADASCRQAGGGEA